MFDEPQELDPNGSPEPYPGSTEVNVDHTSQLELVHHAAKLIGPPSTNEQRGTPRRMSHDFINLPAVRRSQIGEQNISKWLLPLAECLKDLHDGNHVHGGLEPRCVYVPNDEGKPPWLIAIAASGESQEVQQTFQDDVKKLGDIYYYILGSGRNMNGLPVVGSDIEYGSEASKEEVAHLISKMKLGKIQRIEEVLQHPFFWKEKKKIQYIVDAFDFMKKKEIKSLKYVEDPKNHKARIDGYEIDVQDHVIDASGWISKLSIEGEELDEVIERNGGLNVDGNVILRLAQPEGTVADPALEERPYTHRPFYNFSHSVYHLMRFFRNYQAHYWENGCDVRAAFGEVNSKYWTFFSSRFPKLICHVYDRMKDRVKPSD